MPSNVPFLKEKLDELNKSLRFAWVNRDDKVYVFFHMGTNVPNGANMIDCLDRLFCYSRRGTALIQSLTQCLNFFK